MEYLQMGNIECETLETSVNVYYKNNNFPENEDNKNKIRRT
jgi:hypothetical protein